jgi:hypothetical protein
LITRKKTSIPIDAAINGIDATCELSFVKMCLELVMGFQNVVKVDIMSKVSMKTS